MNVFAIAGTVLSGGAAGAAAWWLTTLSGTPAHPASDQPRQRALRRDSLIYRWFEPLVLGLARCNARFLRAWAASLERPLQVLGLDAWRPGEYLAVRQVEGVLLAAGLALLASQLVGGASVLFAALGGLVLLPVWAARRLKKRSRAYVSALTGRLPYALDLMALMLEAGAGTLEDCIRQAALDSPDHPLSRELRRVLTALEQGAGMADCLRQMDERIDDPDVREMVRTVNVATERGAPLREALRDLSARMQERYLQRLERSAEEAKVKISGPSLLVMFACLLIVVAPLLIQGAPQLWQLAGGQ